MDNSRQAVNKKRRQKGKNNGLGKPQEFGSVMSSSGEKGIPEVDDDGNQAVLIQLQLQHQQQKNEQKQIKQEFYPDQIPPTRKPRSNNNNKRMRKTDNLSSLHIVDGEPNASKYFNNHDSTSVSHGDVDLAQKQRENLPIGLTLTSLGGSNKNTKRRKVPFETESSAVKVKGKTRVRVQKRVTKNTTFLGQDDGSSMSMSRLNVGSDTEPQSQPQLSSKKGIPDPVSETDSLRYMELCSKYWSCILSTMQNSVPIPTEDTLFNPDSRNNVHVNYDYGKAPLSLIHRPNSQLEIIPIMQLNQNSTTTNYQGGQIFKSKSPQCQSIVRSQNNVRMEIKSKSDFQLMEEPDFASFQPQVKSMDLNRYEKGPGGKFNVDEVESCKDGSGERNYQHLVVPHRLPSDSRLKCAHCKVSYSSRNLSYHILYKCPMALKDEDLADY